MKPTQLDAAVVGAGTAGLFAMARILKKTKNARLFDGGILGTTCARVGCMPSKALIRQANLFCLEAQKQGETADTAQVMQTVRQIRDRLAGGTRDHSEARMGEFMIRENARFVEPMVLEAAGERYQCDSIVLATGSKPVVPPGWKVVPGKVVTTEEFFELPAIGQRVLLVGLGALGVELGQAMARLGISVTAVEMSDRIGNMGDREVARAFEKALEREKNLTCLLKHKAVLLNSGQDVRVEIVGLDTSESSEQSFDLVLLAAGRKPDLERLSLENCGVPLNEKGAPAFDESTLKCLGKNIFLAGDTSGLRPFYHDAADQGRLAGENAVVDGPLHTLNYKVPLTIVFTHPNLCMVGRGPGELPEGSYVTGSATGGGRAIVEQEDPGLVHLYADKESGVLEGAQMAVIHGESMGHFLATAIHCHMTVSEMLELPFYHPSYEELIQTAVLNAERQLA